MRCRTASLLTMSLLAAAAAPGALGQVTLTETGQTQANLALSGVHELSGITFLGGDQFLLVADQGGLMARATIDIDPATGLFNGSPTLDSSITLNPAGGADLEGIAYDPRDGSVLVSNENDHTITRYNPGDAALLGTIDVPAIYNQVAGNRSLESLSLDTINHTLWTANEEALTVDGPLATDTTGTVVRLQRFDDTGQPDGQFAYLTEPHRPSGLAQARNGVSDIVALPDGRLIVMERDLGGGIPTFQIHFYLVDTSNATDTSDFEALAGATYTEADKTHLLSYSSGFSNMEGVALGPRLDDGDYALVLVSDDGGGGGLNGQRTTTLRLAGIALPGDLDGDWRVDGNDLDIILANWGEVDAGVLLQGDTDGDGLVNQTDLNAVLDHWGDGQPPEVVVPEPAGLLGLGVGAMAMFKRTR